MPIPQRFFNEAHPFTAEPAPPPAFFQLILRTNQGFSTPLVELGELGNLEPFWGSGVDLEIQLFKPGGVHYQTFTEFRFVEHDVEDPANTGHQPCRVMDAPFGWTLVGFRNAAPLTHEVIDRVDVVQTSTQEILRSHGGLAVCDDVNPGVTTYYHQPQWFQFLIVKGTGAQDDDWGLDLWIQGDNPDQITTADEMTILEDGVPRGWVGNINTVQFTPGPNPVWPWSPFGAGAPPINCSVVDTPDGTTLVHAFDFNTGDSAVIDTGKEITLEIRATGGGALVFATSIGQLCDDRTGGGGEDRKTFSRT
jgi:hypothetical protein